VISGQDLRAVPQPNSSGAKMYSHILSLGVLVLATSPLCAIAQQSLFDSASGDSTIYLPQTAGVLSYNLGSDQARFDLQHDMAPNGKGDGKSPLLSIGGGIGATIKSGSGNVINKSAPANGGFAEGGVAIRFARQQELAGCVQGSLATNGGHSVQPGQGNPQACHQRNGQFLLTQFHYGRSQFYSLASASTPVPSPTTIVFDQYRGTLAYNRLWTETSLDIRLGLAYVTGTANNLSSLTAETYQPQTITSSSSGQSVLSPSSESVYVGAYKTHIAQQIHADAVFQPAMLDYHFAIDLLFRSDLAGGTGVRYESPGVGVYFFANGKPVVPVCGLAYTYRAGNNQLAITAGWTFGGTTPPPAASATSK
jgi:hypothetical protein